VIEVVTGNGIYSKSLVLEAQAHPATQSTKQEAAGSVEALLL
jgi:hypothetical protein